MPTLPAPLIHLMGVLRPRLLRPDVRVASIAYLDYAGLKKEGFNAVVVDKDNCVTIPHSDSIFPSYASAWTNLLRAFPGRVLVVSNSAGSAKDRGGIGAESLSVSLRAPVLAHRHAKPACARDIIDFFVGRTQPHTLRALQNAPVAAAVQAEDSAEAHLLDKWRTQVASGPLCGPLQSQHENQASSLEEKMVAAQERKPVPEVSPTAPSPDAAPPAAPEPEPETPTAPLRILVIGDRKFTDTLQARQLDEHLAASPFPATLSIQTTDLPQPNDVRLLRRLEDWLAGPELAHGGRAGGVDWAAYTSQPAPVPPAPRWVDAQLARLNPVTALDDGGPPITWDPRSWRPRPVAAAVLAACGRLVAAAGRMLKRASGWGWARFVAFTKAKWADLKEQRRARAEARAREEREREAREDAEREAADKEPAAAVEGGRPQVVLAKDRS